MRKIAPSNTRLQHKYEELVPRANFLRNPISGAGRCVRTNHRHRAFDPFPQGRLAASQSPCARAVRCTARRVFSCFHITSAPGGCRSIFCGGVGGRLASSICRCRARRLTRWQSDLLVHDPHSIARWPREAHAAAVFIALDGVAFANGNPLRGVMAEISAVPSPNGRRSVFSCQPLLKAAHYPTIVAAQLATE